MEGKRYETVWLIRYVLPFLFIVLFTVTTYNQPWSEFSLDRIDITEAILFFAELIITYYMIYLLTVKYELTDNFLIVYSFIFRKKVYEVGSIQWIDEDGIFSFLGRFPVGIDLTVLNFSNGKKLLILGLKEPLRFIQNIRAIQEEMRSDHSL
jgi:general stress protein CsbA